MPPLRLSLPTAGGGGGEGVGGLSGRQLLSGPRAPSARASAVAARATGVGGGNEGGRDHGSPAEDEVAAVEVGVAEVEVDLGAALLAERAAELFAELDSSRERAPQAEV